MSWQQSAALPERVSQLMRCCPVGRVDVKSFSNLPEQGDFTALKHKQIKMHVDNSVGWLQRLHAVKGLSEAKADKMVEAAKKLTNVGSWITGMEAMQKVCAQHLDHTGLTLCVVLCKV